MTEATSFSTLYMHTAVWKEHRLFTNFASFIPSTVHLQLSEEVLCKTQICIFYMQTINYLLNMKNYNVFLFVYFYMKPAIWSFGYGALCMYFMYVCILHTNHFCDCQATNILMTFWMIWPQPGHGA